MKKLTLYTFLVLMFCNVSFAEKSILKLSKDVVSGNKFYKSLNNYGTFKKYGMQVVDKKDGHPVRAGNKSIRFEVRSGDCGKSHNWNDCTTNRERHELHGRDFSGGTWWYAWSIYFPKDFINVYPASLCLGQFHETNTETPPWMFLNDREGYSVNNMVKVPAGFQTKLLTREQMLGKWNDILINARWTHKDEGFFKIWVNNNLAFDYKGPTKRKGKNYFKFGIYRSKVFKKNLPTQIVYFDEIRTGKTKEKVVGNLPPLN